MVAVPDSAIIVVNDDLTDNVRNHLVKQLYISEWMTGSTFDGYVASDPDYLENIKIARKRILVIRSFKNMPNRGLADLLLFVKNGMVDLEFRNCAPVKQVPIKNVHPTNFKRFR